MGVHSPCSMNDLFFHTLAAAWGVGCDCILDQSRKKFGNGVMKILNNKAALAVVTEASLLGIQVLSGY